MDERPSGQRAGPGTASRQPIFLLPGAVMSLVGLMIAIQAAQSLVLGQQGQLQLVMWFGFVPMRVWQPDAVPGGWVPLLWTPLTHAFLHAGWEHVLLNSAWLAIFGTPVARRYGTPKFLIMFAICAVIGAFTFLILASPDAFVLVGASGGIAGLTGAAMRFVFQPVEIARHPETGETIVLGRRLARFGDVLRDTRARFFIIFWLGINALMPVLPALTGGMQMQIAWQAHLGGFIAGFLLVPLLERRKRA